MKEFVNKKIFDLNYVGRYIFIYSSKRNIYFFYEDFKEKKLFKVVTDKYLYIDYIEEIEIPNNFFEYKEIKFYKPIDRHDDIIFVGIIKLDKVYKFNINYKNKLEFVEEIEYKVLASVVDEYIELKDFKFINFIQKKDRIYGVAYDNKYNIESYIEFNLSSRKIEKCYSLYSDDWYIIPVVVDIDKKENRVLVGGYKKNVNNGKIVPYLEHFAM